MRHPCSQKRNGGGGLPLQLGHGAVAALRHIADDRRRQSGILRKRHQVELNEPPDRVENLHLLPGHPGPLLLIFAENAPPVHPLQQLGNPQMRKVFRQGEQLLRRAVEITDFQPPVHDQNSLFHRIEHRFEKSAFPGEAQDVGLTAVGIEIVEPFTETIQKIFIDAHCILSISCH